MSNDELEKYKDMYAELVSHFAELHNTHMSFVKHCGRETGFATRKHLAAMVKIANQMRKQGVAAYRQHKINLKLEHRRLKEEKRNNKKKKRNDLVL
jgi:hypothetical protein